MRAVLLLLVGACGFTAPPRRNLKAAALGAAKVPVDWKGLLPALKEGLFVAADALRAASAFAASNKTDVFLQGRLAAAQGLPALAAQRRGAAALQLEALQALPAAKWGEALEALAFQKQLAQSRVLPLVNAAAAVRRLPETTAEFAQGVQRWPAEVTASLTEKKAAVVAKAEDIFGFPARVTAKARAAARTAQDAAAKVSRTATTIFSALAGLVDKVQTKPKAKPAAKIAAKIAAKPIAQKPAAEAPPAPPASKATPTQTPSPPAAAPAAPAAQAPVAAGPAAAAPAAQAPPAAPTAPTPTAPTAAHLASAGRRPRRARVDGADAR